MCKLIAGIPLVTREKVTCNASVFDIVRSIPRSFPLFALHPSLNMMLVTALNIASADSGRGRTDGYLVIYQVKRDGEEMGMLLEGNAAHFFKVHCVADGEALLVSKSIWVEKEKGRSFSASKHTSHPPLLHSFILQKAGTSSSSSLIFPGLALCICPAFACV